MTFSATAVFCEDIREEKTGQQTIVGVFSDNLNLQVQRPQNGDPLAAQGVPVFPKLGTYTRVVVNVDDLVSSLAAVLLMPDGTEHALGSFDADTIKRTQTDARTKGSPIVGFVFKALIAPFIVDRSGIISIHIRTETEDRIVGILNATLITDEAA